jgi:acetoin utilization deacetylase AcuC-like enzyme
MLEPEPMPKPIPVFYTPRMIAESGCESPSAAKPVAVVESWSKQFPIEIIEPAPAEFEELAMAHDAEFVKLVLLGARANGFGNKSKEVAASLPYTSGAMLAAARHVTLRGGAAAAPCSGFHHAGYASAEGFCTFNGLMVTALALKKDDQVDRVGILDLDMHYGNGTDNIIRKLSCESWIRHFTGGARYTSAAQVPEFFSQKLPEVLAAMATCDLVLYQAGADPHINDPYGGWLTTEELRKRDAMVFDALRERDVPVAWNLAGGYQRDADGGISKVLEVHDNTMRECIRAFGG